MTQNLKTLKQRYETLQIKTIDLESRINWIWCAAIEIYNDRGE